MARLANLKYKRAKGVRLCGVHSRPPKVEQETASQFPQIDNKTGPELFTPRKANYTCFNFTVSNQGTNKHDAEDVDSDWCAVTYLARGKVNRQNGTYIGPWACADLYYYYGEYRLYVRIPSGTSGLCAMVCVGAPLVFAGGKGGATG